MSFFSSKNEQSSFCVFWCQFRVEGAILEKKITPMTPIKIKSYPQWTIARFMEFFGQKVPKERFLDTLYLLKYISGSDKYLKNASNRAHIS